jgi:arylsulfatase A-like enzyme
MAAETCPGGTSVMAMSATATAAEKPNILVIFGDDIGQTNISAYSMGVVGYKTPNIDRIAKEGMMFTDYYAENSCTAGRSSFITGQTPLRTGLSKVGLPGATVGLQKRDITIAQALKSQGYATGQFGKNHLGDRDEYLPTNHGFDEFFGNLYHLNAEEEPERPYWPKDDPEFVKANHAAWGDPQLRRRQDRRHRCPDHQAHGNHRRRNHRRSPGVHRETGQGRQAVLRLDEHHAHALVHPCA